MRHAWAVPLISLLLGFSLSAPSLAQQTLKPDPEALEAFHQNDAKYNEARDKKDLEAIMAFYADDAVMVGPPGIFVGKEKIKNWYIGVLKASSHVVVKTEQAYTDGPVTWAYGTWTAQVDVGDGKTEQRHGSFANLHRDQKIVLDSWNRAFEPTPPAVSGSSASK
jgi:ketosteroid isomerase-like protein